MARIPDQFVNSLLARVDIVELIQSRVTLKKSGRNYMACCPFHQEKSPSFSVAPDKQFYYCFGCGASGNAVGFLMEYDRLTFPEAVRQLADKAGMAVPQENDFQPNRQQKDQHQQLYEVLHRAELFFNQQLRSANERDQAVNYLKGRGLSGTVAKQYSLGFAPPGFDNLMNALSLDDKGLQTAITAGLLVRREDTGRVYDKFRHRIMFPIRDARGRTIGFGGRILEQGEPKYLNSPETPVFHKGQELYGLWEWRQSRDKSDTLFVVEGYMDVIALAQSGITNAVATLGTATTSEHVQKLFRQVKQVVFCFDGDNAGRRAAWRALESTLPQLDDDKAASFLFLDEGEDPDTIVRKEGREGFLARAAQAPSLSQYFFRQLQDNVDSSTLDGRARLARQALPLIHTAKGTFFRSLLTRELGQITQLSEDQLLQVAPTENQTRYGEPTIANVPPPMEEAPWAAPARQPLRLKLNQVERLILTLIHHPQVVQEHPLPEGIEELQHPQLEVLINQCGLLRENPDLPGPALLGSLMALEHGNVLAELIRESDLPPPTLQQSLSDWQDGLLELTIQHLEQQLASPHIELTTYTTLIRQLDQARQQLRNSRSLKGLN